MKINITYATILGTSQMLAEDLEDALSVSYTHLRAHET